MAQLASKVTLAGPGKLVVSFAAKYNSGKIFCERPETASKLQRELSRLAGKGVELAFQLEADASGGASPPTSARQRSVQVCQRPFVRKALELFDATAGRTEEPERVS